MKARGGFGRARPQDGLNLFWFVMNGPKDKMDEVNLCFELAFSRRKRIKYRNVFSKKPTGIEIPITRLQIRI